MIKEICAVLPLLHYTIWLAVDRTLSLLLLDYQKECGIEGDKYMFPLHPPDPVFFQSLLPGCSTSGLLFSARH